MSQILFAGFIASLVWFFIGGILYTNPIVAKIYKAAEVSPGLKKWASIPKYLFLQYVGILIQCLLWAIVFSFIRPVLPADALSAGVTFGLILVALIMIPRLYDMWIQSTYPNNLLVIEFINGTIGGLVIGVTLGYLI